jgi:photosystem II stability/assembly factor-like uncharacterized protein
MRGLSVRGVAVVLLLLLLSGAVPVVQAQDDWWRVGISANYVGLEISPGWPDDPRLLVMDYDGRMNEVVLSPDGGRTWKRNAKWTGYGVQIAPPYGVERALFGSTLSSLRRSLDDGQTWDTVLEGHSGRVVFSPTFAQDGLALLVNDTTTPAPMHVSRDGGATWGPIDPMGGAEVTSAVFSPAFAVDHTIVAATPGGIMVSSDAGASWPGVSAVEVGGVPYRPISAIVPSAGFAEDGTLLVLAAEPGESRAPVPVALFRSRDRGRSWVSVQAFSPVASPSGGIALSPTFASDGTALAWVSRAGSQRACDVFRTVDGGESWQGSDGGGSECSPLYLVRSADALVGIAAERYSPDGGVTWQRLTDPTGQPMKRILPSPTFAEDQLVLAYGSGTSAPLWAIGPRAAALFGQMPFSCPLELGGGFGRLFQAEAEVRNRLGCPVSPEQPVALWEQETAAGRVLRTEQGTPVELSPAPSGAWGVSRLLKEESPASRGDDPPIQGVRQEFQNGSMFFLPRPDGRRTIVVVARWGETTSWREWPDEPTG